MIRQRSPIFLRWKLHRMLKKLIIPCYSEKFLTMPSRSMMFCSKCSIVGIPTISKGILVVGGPIACDRFRAV